MENTKTYESMDDYCDAHRIVSRFQLESMMQIVKARVSAPLFLTREMGIADKLVADHQEVLIGSLEHDDYMKKLVEVSENPELLQSTIAAAEAKYPHVTDLVMIVAKQSHLLFLFEKIYFNQYIPSGMVMGVYEDYDPAEMKKRSDEAWAKTANFINAMFEMMAYHDNLYAKILELDVSSLTHYALNNISSFTVTEFVEDMSKKIGSKGVALLIRFGRYSMEIANCAIQAYDKMQKESNPLS